MAQQPPVLIYAFEEAERGIPVTDEDVARGFLEDGWVPVLDLVARSFVSAPADAPTGTLTFFMCAWPVFRYPCGTWATNATRIASMRKMPCTTPHEELVVEPIALEDVQVGMVIASKVVTAASPYVVDHIAVCCDRTANGLLSVRLLGSPAGHDPHHVHHYNFFVVCKQPREPFVLK